MRPASCPRAANSGAGGKGGGFPWIWLIIVAVIGLGVLLALRMRAVSRDRRKRARVGSIGTARSFHATRLDKLSFRHSELVRAVGERPDDPALAEHHQTAGAKLVALRRQLPQLYSPRELRTCAGELDLTEWHIECAEALAEGRGLPPQPSPDRPALCFFTHEHGLGTSRSTSPDPTARWRRSGSARPTPSRCRAPSRCWWVQVHVGGRQVPWPAAPTYYGAAGWSPDDLPGLEYEGREIWGREAPFRDEPIDVPPDAVPSVPPEADAAARRRHAAAAGCDGAAADRRGRAAARRARADGAVPAASDDEVTGEREPPPAPAASAAPEPASPNGAPLFEELEQPRAARAGPGRRGRGRSRRITRPSIRTRRRRTIPSLRPTTSFPRGRRTTHDKRD